MFHWVCILQIEDSGQRNYTKSYREYLLLQFKLFLVLTKVALVCNPNPTSFSKASHKATIKEDIAISVQPLFPCSTCWMHHLFLNVKAVGRTSPACWLQELRQQHFNLASRGTSVDQYLCPGLEPGRTWPQHQPWTPPAPGEIWMKHQRGSLPNTTRHYNEISPGNIQRRHGMFAPSLTWGFRSFPKTMEVNGSLWSRTVSINLDGPHISAVFL